MKAKLIVPAMAFVAIALCSGCDRCQKLVEALGPKATVINNIIPAQAPQALAPAAVAAPAATPAQMAPPQQTNQNSAQPTSHVAVAAVPRQLPAGFDPSKPIINPESADNCEECDTTPADGTKAPETAPAPVIPVAVALPPQLPVIPVAPAAVSQTSLLALTPVVIQYNGCYYKYQDSPNGGRTWWKSNGTSWGIYRGGNYRFPSQAALPTFYRPGPVAQSSNHGYGYGQGQGQGNGNLGSGGGNQSHASAGAGYANAQASGSHASAGGWPGAYNNGGWYSSSGGRYGGQQGGGYYGGGGHSGGSGHGGGHQ